MTTQNAELISQLNTLLRLTAHEAATARARVSQATTDATRKELLENARNCDLRADALRQAVRDLGGAPDALGVALGKAAAAAKLPLEQTLPITEALLSDLALEHQLFDRARFVKVLAADADAPELVALAEQNPGHRHSSQGKGARWMPPRCTASSRPRPSWTSRQRPLHGWSPTSNSIWARACCSGRRAGCR